jgi:NAD(P)-dependent dehydrogenase (short-subunit alcohol dehydrogenase family)
VSSWERPTLPTRQADMEVRRVALVTGGTRGLGRAVSDRLVSDGVTVAAAFHHDHDAAEAWRGSLGSDAEVSLHSGDLGDVDVCQRLVSEVVDAHGRLDYLINNAGGMAERRLADIEPEMWELSLRRNLSSAFFLAQAAVPAMTAQRFGRIVNIGSVSAAMGNPFQIDYASAKAGMVGLTRSLARAVVRRGVTVNCVIPGGFETSILDAMTLTDRSVIEKNVPIGRFGRPEELAHVVVSLLHEDAAYVTGSVIVVDGGMSMGT